MGTEAGEIQIKGTYNLFNNIITENFPNLERRRDIQVQESYRTPNHQDEKRNIPRHIIIKTQYSEGCKTETTDHIKAHPLE
jgi:hypothetical protein